jgi:hypothetical protein
MSDLIKAFVIGSSWPAFILYFYGVSRFPDNIKNYSYVNYTMIAPIALGIFNVIGYVVAKKLKLTRSERFILTGLAGAIGVSIFITITNAYNFSTKKEWTNQYIKLLIIYIFVFGVIINGIDYMITTKS